MEESAAAVAIALADLRGSVDTGFAKLDGRLDVALQRTDTVERTTQELKAKVEALEAKIWRFSLAAAAVGSGGGMGLWQFLHG